MPSEPSDIEGRADLRSEDDISTGDLEVVPDELPVTPIFDMSATPISRPLLVATLKLREREGNSTAMNLVLSGALSPEVLRDYLAQRFAAPPIEPDTLAALTPRALRLLPEELIFDAGLLPLSRDASWLTVAMTDPSDPTLLQEMELLGGRALELRTLAADEMARHFERLAGRRWKLRPDASMRRSGALDAPTRALLDRCFDLDEALDTLDDKALAFMIRPGGAQPMLELTRTRRAVIANRQRRSQPVLSASERPRVSLAARPGSSRLYLDPVVKGEAVLRERTGRQRLRGVIEVDTTIERRGSVAVDLGAASAQGWYEPTHTPSLPDAVQEGLRQAVSALSQVEAWDQVWTQVLATLRSGYQRAGVLRVRGRELVAVAVTDGARVETFDPARAPHIKLMSITQAPALIERAGECLEVNEDEAPALGAEAATSCILTGLAVQTDQATLLLYADAGPGVRAPRHPALWRVVHERVPAALRQLVLTRKRRWPWEVKA